MCNHQEHSVLSHLDVPRYKLHLVSDNALSLPPSFSESWRKNHNLPKARRPSDLCVKARWQANAFLSEVEEAEVFRSAAANPHATSPAPNRFQRLLDTALGEIENGSQSSRGSNRGGSSILSPPCMPLRQESNNSICSYSSNSSVRASRPLTMPQRQESIESMSSSGGGGSYRRRLSASRLLADPRPMSIPQRQESLNSMSSSGGGGSHRRGLAKQDSQDTFTSYNSSCRPLPIKTIPEDREDQMEIRLTPEDLTNCLQNQYQSGRNPRLVSQGSQSSLPSLPSKSSSSRSLSSMPITIEEEEEEEEPLEIHFVPREDTIRRWALRSKQYNFESSSSFEKEMEESCATSFIRRSSLFKSPDEIHLPNSMDSSANSAISAQ